MHFRYWLENKDITETEEFKKWFAGSILKDENGDPIPVYHGTQARPFDKFDSSRTTTGRIDKQAARGVFSFTFSFDYAAMKYAGLRKDNPEKTKEKLQYFPHGRTIEAYLRVTNPFDFRKREHLQPLIDYRRKETDEWARTKARFLRPGEESANQRGITEENREQKIKEYVDKQVADFAKWASEGQYAQLEAPTYLKRNGFDAVYTMEFDQLHIHVLDSDQIWIVKQQYNRDMV
jgi:hypothetical protein